MLSEFRTLTSAIVQGTLSASDVIYAPGGNSDQWNLNGGGDLSIIQSSSANWESTYTTVSSSSATWGTGGSVYDDSLLQAASGNWNSTYTTVGSYSASWESTFTTVGSNSADWVTYSSDNISTANWVIDEDNLGSESATKVPTQQSVKAYVDGIVTGINNLKGGYDASTDQPAISAGVGVLQGDSYYVETDGGGLFYNVQVDPGDLIIATIDNADEQEEWIVVNRNIQDELIDKWNSTYTTVSAQSADWDSTYTTVDTESADWDSTYTTVSSFSATWGEGASVTIQSTPPAAIDSEAGDLWFDDTSGKLFVYYADLDTDQWVDTSGGISDLDNVVTSPDTDPVAETTQLAEIIQITQAGYNALSPPAANTLYIIVN